MEVLNYDKKTLMHEYSECADLKALVARLERQAQLSGKVICSIRLNGMALSETDETRFAETQVSEIDQLELKLETTTKLVAETLISLRDSLQRLKDRSLSVADMVRQNPAGNAQIQFSHLMEQMRCLTEALSTLKFRARLNEDSIAVWSRAEGSTAKMIKELLQAFSAQDFILVGDILEYELHNLLEQWVEVIDYCDFD